MALLPGLALAAGALLVWALGLYVFSRAPARPAPMLATAAMGLLAAYLVGESLAALAPDLQTWAAWLRRAWWAPSLAAPCWLVLTLALAREEDLQVPGAQPRGLYEMVSVAALSIGAIFAVLGSATLLVADWSAPSETPARHVPAGPLLLPFQVFVVICLALGLLNVARCAWFSPRPVKSRFVWLCASASLFLVGGAWLVVASGVYQQPGLLGQVALIAGMVIMGWNLARYGALLAGESVLSDFIAFAVTMLAVVALYGLIVVMLASDYGWIERGLPLLLLVMATHVLVDTRGHVLDRVLYLPGIGTLRGQLRDLSNRVVRQPDALSALVDVRETVELIMRERTAEAGPSTSGKSDWRVLVEGALRHMNDLPALSQHPLLGELAMVKGTPLERAAALRNDLDQAIERLRPAGARPTPGSSAIGGWLHYLVLKEAYSDGRPNKQVMQRYVLSESTFHRARRSAIDALAADLAEPQRATDSSPSTSSGPTRSTV